MNPGRPEENYRELRSFALREGVSLFGVADLGPLRGSLVDIRPRALEGLQRAVGVAFHLSDRVLEDIEDGPTHLYYFHYRRVNLLLDDLLLKITGRLQRSGAAALPVPASQVIDWDSQRAHLSHKHIAREAGLGWIGRNNLLVTPEFGARVRLGTVLTDLELPAGRPAEFGCGECRACLECCPSGSIAERPEDFDHRGCYEQIRRMVQERNIGQNVCGLCVKACRGPAPAG